MVKNTESEIVEMEYTRSIILRKFHDRIKSGILNSDIKVVYRIVGGKPSEQIDMELTLFGDGKAELKGIDLCKSEQFIHVFAAIDRMEVFELFQNLDSSFENMMPPTGAGLLPDSVSRFITIEVEGIGTTLNLEDTPRSPSIQLINKILSKLSEMGGICDDVIHP